MVSQKNTYTQETSFATDYDQEETGWLRHLLVEEEPIVGFLNREIPIRKIVWGPPFFSSDIYRNQL